VKPYLPALKYHGSDKPSDAGRYRELEDSQQR
jgi:hypothetical protein